MPPSDPVGSTHHRGPVTSGCALKLRLGASQDRSTEHRSQPSWEEFCVAQFSTVRTTSRLEDPGPGSSSPPNAIVRASPPRVCAGRICGATAASTHRQKPSPARARGTAGWSRPSVPMSQPSNRVTSFIGSFFASMAPAPTATAVSDLLSAHGARWSAAKNGAGAWADGTLVATPDTQRQADSQSAGRLRAVLGTAGSPRTPRRSHQDDGGRGGDGAVGLCGVIAAAQLGADRIIAMEGRHSARQQLAPRFSALTHRRGTR